jgi:hypothetical protein
MHPRDWYDKLPWAKEAPPAGVYRLRLPVPGSERMTAGEQAALLPAGETLAPVALVVAALLCIRLQDGVDPLDGGWTRCAEQTAGYHVDVAWIRDRLGVDSFRDDVRLSYLWVSSVRTS